MTGTLTLDTLGDPHALFVFQIGSTLTTSVGSSVVVLGGPNDNIFWQVGSSATIGVGTAFVGNIVALTSITLNTGATLSSGRALARNGAVTVDFNVADSTTPSQNNTSEFSAPARIPVPTVTLGVSPTSFNEALGTSTVTATLSAISGQNVTVTLAYSGVATNLLDYTRSGTTIVILAGNTSGTVTLTAVQDSLDEADEAIVIDISAVTNGTESGIQQVTANILDDDTAPTVTLAILPTTVSEALGTATVTATLSAISGQNVIVDLAYSGTATNVSDYVRSGAQITILAGSLTGTVTLTAVQDLLDEANETVLVEISSVTNGTESGTQQDTLTITDDDAAPSLSINDVVVVEGDTGVSNVVFTVTLSAASGQSVTVVTTSADGTASASADYFAVPQTTLIFAPGETSKTVTVLVRGDTLDEANETFFVILSNPTNATVADPVGQGTITDDELAPTLSINNVSIVEGNVGTTNLVFTVSLSAASGQTVSVVATSADDTATAPFDYLSLPPTTLIFAPGETSKTITVAVNGDSRLEDDETFNINLTTAVNASIADSLGVGTITNDEIDRTMQSGFVGLVDDPDNFGRQMLLVVGTILKDVIHFRDRLYGNQIQVILNNVNVGVFDNNWVSRIVVYGLAGNDHIHVYLSLGKATELHGDEGNDTLYGGVGRDELFGGEGDDYVNGRSGLDRLYGEEGNDRLHGENGHDILLGGSGNDKLYGGNDRDILIGGIGTDTLYGQSGDDILIGGETTHDDNVSALDAILSEWTSGNSYADRVANIRDGSGDLPGQNDGNFFDDGTILDDGDVDQLFGGGNQDWFFKFDNDILKDKRTSSHPKFNELVN